MMLSSLDLLCSRSHTFNALPSNGDMMVALTDLQSSYCRTTPQWLSDDVGACGVSNYC